MNKLLLVWPDNEREVWNVPPGGALHAHDGNENRPPRQGRRIGDITVYSYGRIPQVTLLDRHSRGPAGEVFRTFE
jgi:hypothetical protein